MLYFTGFSRTASEIAKSQIDNTPNKKRELSLMCQMVDEGIKILNENRDIRDFGKLLHEAWLLKKSLTDKISIPETDHIYERAGRAGALGGKLLGAGGGGFMILFVPPENQGESKRRIKRFA